MSGDNTRDIVIRLEAEVETIKAELHDVKKTVTELRDLLLQARGAKWALLAMAGLGGFVSAKLAVFVPWFK
jgi:multidrug efflux pump subunit AcrA (membrane-fusion protein)